MIDEYFKYEYNKEIGVTLDRVNNYIRGIKKCKKIELKNWEVFCYENFT
jgi:hypothetical protein